MNYKLERLNEDDITDFLLDPLLKTAYYNDYLVQKFPINESADQVVFFDKESLFFNKVGYVLYQKKEIVVVLNRIEDEIIFTNETLNKENYRIWPIIVSDIRKETQKRVGAIEEKIRLDNQLGKSELLKSSECENCVQLPGFMLVDQFFEKVNHETLIYSYLGDPKVIDEFINSIFRIYL